MSTVFVTGANGFIGTHLVRALDRPRGAPPVLDFDPRRRETPPRNKDFGAGSAHGRHARREEHDGIGSIWRSMGKSRASRGSPA
jgi:nucleoside-diphosphate-sugar epimerase